MEYSKDDTLIFEKAFAFKNEGFYLEALNILYPLEVKYANDKIIIGLLATLYFELRDYDNSEKYFRKASQLSPNSELASLGLFHSLFHQKKTLLGLKEIQRFISSNKYELYKTTISELRSNFKNFDNREKEIIRTLG